MEFKFKEKKKGVSHSSFKKILKNYANLVHVSMSAIHNSLKLQIIS